ncbi:MAG: hypothetical protein KZQ56_10860, partial [gamma proteobacterium symbiont of Lucinoma myriamae]|nr:hypothetical protein [gamma proteobacterium symbiont of Lucinoma myriamae]MCU7833070.1 hypothetical protein [gamma proteobacterium symbiont of Lucinoma myriamae]
MGKFEYILVPFPAARITTWSFFFDRVFVFIIHFLLKCLIIVYARHGHKLMGCKSPVGGSPLCKLYPT